jgi:LacI family transcriptional regulator
VSRVMNNDRYVSDDVRQRVERAIADLQYVPNPLARTFGYGRDAAIGIAVPDISDRLSAAVIHAVEEIARDRGVALFVTSVGTDGKYEQAAVEALLGRQIAGLISTPFAADQSYLMRWRSRTAMVFIDRAPSNITADTVVEDDRGGGYAATAHLIEHGHRRIGFIGDSASIATAAGRLEGYRAALSDAGIDEDRRLVALGAMSSREAAEAIRSLLSRPKAPTALSRPMPGARSASCQHFRREGTRILPWSATATSRSRQRSDPLSPSLIKTRTHSERLQQPGSSSGLTTQTAVGSDAWFSRYSSCCAPLAPEEHQRRAMARPATRHLSEDLS